jgi:adenylyltransferase/sulfurtransferase
VPNCAQYGTLGGIVGAIGAIQSIEVCKLALGLIHCKERGLTPLIGRLWVADARYWDTRNLKVKKNTRCPVCGVPPEDISLTPTPPLLCTKTLVTTLSLTDVEAMRQSGQNVFILDVRESHEWKIKRLPNAHLIPLHTLINDSSSLKSINANQTIAVHCEGGTRSITACEYLIKNGFNACNLIVDWATVNQFM